LIARVDTALLVAMLAAGAAPWATSIAGQVDLRVEFAGCEAVRDGPVCVVSADEQLTLWVDVEAAVSLRIDGARVVRRATVLGGEQLLLDVRRASQRLVVSTDSNATWELAFAASTSPAWLSDARQLMDEGRIEEARERVDVAAHDHSDPYRGPALGVLARLAQRQAQWTEAERRLRDAMAADNGGGWLSDEARDGCVLLWLLIERGRFAEAAAVLERLPRPRGQSAEMAFYHDYYGAMLAKERGDLRTGLQLSARAVERAERLDLPELDYAKQVLAGRLQVLGRTDEAQETFASLLAGAPLASDCDRALLLDNAAWARLLECEAGPCTPPVEELEEVVSLHGSDCLDSPAEHLNALVNLALAHYHAGDDAAARDALDHARALDTDPALRYAVWILDIEGRLAMREDRSDEALQVYSRMQELAEQFGSLEAKWRAAVGRARVLAAANPTEAGTAYAAAEALLESESRFVPLHEGRDTFVARRERVTREYLALLLSQGAQDDAFAVTRRARARVLRGAWLTARLAALSPRIGDYADERQQVDAMLEGFWAMSARSRATLEARRLRLQHELLALLDDVSLAVTSVQQTADEALPVLAGGEVALAYHPLPAGWVGFAADARGVTARPLASLEHLRGDSAALADAVFSPFAPQIGHSEAVRLLPYGLLREVDLHALPLGGRPLVDSKPTAFALDLPGVQPQEEDGVRLALLVADPAGDLPWTLEEVKAIAGSLDESWRVEVLSGAAATSAQVRALMPRADLFHYAGHAVFKGRGGWDSELPLAQGTRLGIEDILSFERVPQRIVLSGCEAGASAPSGAESMGLAQAFLMAGASEVVAPTRVIADRDATALITSLYERWAASGDLRVALQHAQQSLGRTRPAADWASFRIMVR
jgi:hypothetical protein